MQQSQQQSQANNAIVLKYINTPLGKMIAGATDDGLACLLFTDVAKLNAVLKRIGQHTGTTPLSQPLSQSTSTHHPIIERTEQQLDEYFAGKRTAFDIPLAALGTDFQQASWQYLQSIPYGHTSTYQAQANALNRCKAVRAVANANAKNPIGIIVPCHRVIGSNGKLTGYAGGLDRKAALLELESANQ
ncbi:methylated-DNA--[protein]-cysteine S-methyltransferase [Cardiobacteriales bacterium ML27]|uniref:Methylated-DNA--protein-cysteine methyltransferase n=2 Tax=Ostreibacterium oceani TaxID=2654998 RepID=A0A6N7EY90_9GAMM|nr:methylated-DNA--[protein]-cysteine S-methyltransferase [Ostreibacterium oceani]